MKILVVEDDPTIAEPLVEGLGRHGFDARSVGTGREAVEAAESVQLVLLDLGLPDLDGYEVCRQIRATSAVAIIVVSARGDEIDRVSLLEMGADDYVVKPFSLQELLARLRAVLRRRVRDSSIVQFSDTVVDLNAKTVARAGTPVELTAQEFKLLGHFVSHPGHTFSRDELLSGAWGFGYEGTARTVDNFVSQLRTKFEPDPENPRHFKTVRGLGYRFDP